MENSTNNEQCPFDPEELGRAVASGNIHHSLNNENLKKSAHIIFGDEDHISQEYYQKTIVAGNYLGFDLEKHGFPNLMGHLKQLTEYFSKAINSVNKTTRHRSDKVLFMGEGRGRTSIAAIEIAKQLRVKEVHFNDLLSEHVEHIREKIAKCYNTRDQVIDGVEISFSAGDFVEVSKKFRKRFDAIFAMWVVTSEIADFSSVDALQKLRKSLYEQVKLLLTKQGVFIEDIPFSEGIGTFYHIARLKTYKILNGMGIMEGENNHMLLSDFSDTCTAQFLQHIRYIPSNGKKRHEMNVAGFCENESSIYLAPNGIKYPELYNKEIGSDEKIRQLFSGNSIDEIIPYLTRKEQDLLNFPKPNELLAHKTKTTLWRQYPKTSF